MSKRKAFTMFVSSLCLMLGLCSCSTAPSSQAGGNYMLAKGQKLLGNRNYPAICYSGHRKKARTVENTPSIAETKEDLMILSAMGIKIIRTYNTTLFPHAERILKSMRELRQADPDFEMYVMLGAWIQCVNANKEGTDHSVEDEASNQSEIETAIRMAAEYPDIVKIIAVGNEAMVDWQTHFVPAATILKWVEVLKAARDDGRIPADTLITTSDNWAALGGEERYRNEDLAELMRQIDYVSLHTYAFHDTYYNPKLQWAPLPEETGLPLVEQVARSIERAIELQKDQYQAVKDYLREIGIDKEIHIGETGWASLDNAYYGEEGTRAASEYIQKLFYDAVRSWTGENHLSCFYFEAFDEPWKSKGTDGSEGHFGLFTVDGQAKYAIWDLVDAGLFKTLQRGGRPITKTHGGNSAILIEKLSVPHHIKN